MAGRTVRVAVFVEPGRISLDERPLRYVTLEYRSRSARADGGFAKAYGTSIFICVVALSMSAFVALSAWAF